MKKSYFHIILSVVIFMLTTNLSAEKQLVGAQSIFNDLKAKAKPPTWIKEGKSFPNNIQKANWEEITIDDFIHINLPYEQNHTYNGEFTVLDENLGHIVPLKFTLTEEKVINIAAINDELGLIPLMLLFKDGISYGNLIYYEYEFEMPEYVSKLLPGNYYLVLYDERNCFLIL
jgi:hypothetical protein